MCLKNSSTRLMAIFLLWFTWFLITLHAADILTPGQVFKDGNVINSAAGIFQLGFCSPGSSENRYLCIWYQKIGPDPILWMENRDNPVFGHLGVLTIDNQGTLVLSDNKTVAWSSNSLGPVSSPMAQLIDSGNLIVRNVDNSNYDYLWQSFDHPGDTLLPGMKLGWDLIKGKETKLTSWKSAKDPSQGKYTCSLSLDGYPQLFVRFGSVLQYRLGLGDVTGSKDMTDKFSINQKEVYYSYEVGNSDVNMRMVLTSNGTLQLMTWIDLNKRWEIYFTTGKDACSGYRLCGAYGVCYSTGCQCLEGFEPKYVEKGKVTDQSAGCTRKTQLNCKGGDGFREFINMRLPDTQNSVFDLSINLKECERICFKNCSCTAFTNIDVTGGGTGCLLWFGDLDDIRVGNSNLRDLYVRVASSELDTKKGLILKIRVVIAVGVVLLALALALSLGLFLRHVSKKKKESLRIRRNNDTINENERDNAELPLYEFTTIASATNNFSNSNKLGQGGFGPVYKGILGEGEIAVKRLSRNSKQGLTEFKNEIACIVKLQHRNLVRLLGCCIQQGEMLLIYEYMPNRSLDNIIFDKELSQTLDWTKRFNIVNGIARGLLYLHQDSRLRIIHRDLKVSNILLDNDKNPRISDFGLARSFGESDVQVNTINVAGTHGYMSPEYLIDGVFSTKSDVYSFGVVVLEIVSGEKIREYCHPEHNLNLLGYAWKVYAEGNCLELIDSAILGSCNMSEVVRAVQIGLLCVQPYARDRPNMSSVVAMLCSEIELPQPQQPGIFTESQLPDLADNIKSSGNELSATSLAPR